MLGTGPQLTAALDPVGEHEVTLTAIDREGLASSTSVTVEVVYGPPVVMITSPAAGARYVVNDWIPLVGEADDVAAPTGLPDDAFVWDSSLANDPLPRQGSVYGVRLSEPGDRTLSLSVTSPSGASGTASVDVSIQAGSAEAPTVDVVEPTEHEVLASHEVHFISASITSHWSGTGINLSAEGAALDFDGVSYEIVMGEVATGFVPEHLLPLGLCGDLPAHVVRWYSDRGGRTTTVVPVVLDFPDC